MVVEENVDETGSESGDRGGGGGIAGLLCERVEKIMHCSTTSSELNEI